MKSSNSSLLAITTIFLSLFNIIIPHTQASSNSAIDNFLQCLPRYSNPSYPISNALYSTQGQTHDSSSLSFIQFQIRDVTKSSNFTTSTYPSKITRDHVVAALDVNYVQAAIVCARANGLQITTTNGNFDGLAYASDVPVIILEV